MQFIENASSITLKRELKELSLVFADQISTNPKQVRKKIKKLLNYAITDQAIFVFMRIPEDVSVWEYKNELEEHFLCSPDWTISDKDSYGERAKQVDVLMLKDHEISILEKEGVVGGVCAFYAGACRTALYPNEFKMVAPMIAGNNYFLFKEGKDNDHFYSENKDDQAKDYQVDLGGLAIGIDITRVCKFDALSKDFPELFTLPGRIQDKLKCLPPEYENMPPRLKYLRQAYVKYWGDGASWKRVEDMTEIKAIHNNAQEFILNLLEDEDVIAGGRLGRDFAKVAASFILPDCFELDSNEPVKGSSVLVSDYISKKFWFIHCAAERLLMNLKPEDFEEDKKMFINVLWAFNQPKREATLDAFEQSMAGMLRFCYSDLEYFRDVCFKTKEEALCAARICLSTGLKKSR